MCAGRRWGQPAPNRKGLPSYQYNVFEPAFFSRGEEACRNGLTPRDVWKYIIEDDPVAYASIIEGKSDGHGDALKYVSHTLNDYSQINDNKPAYGRRPYYFKLSAPNEPRRFTLKQEVWDRHYRKRNAERQAASRHFLREQIAEWEGAEVQCLNAERERGGIALKFKRQLSHYSCEVCHFDFEATYGRDAKGFIEAYHKFPLAGGERLTTIEDFNAVCSNCHRMLHHKPNPLKTVEQLRRLMARCAKRPSHLIGPKTANSENE